MADQEDIFKQVSPEAIGGIVNFAIGSASRLLKENGDMKGADLLSAGAKSGDINAVLGESLSPELMPAGNKKDKAEDPSTDEEMVSKGAGVAAKGALTACGVPPPASDIIGDKIGQAVGKAYTEAKEKLQAVNPVAVTSNILEGLSEGLDESMKGASDPGAESAGSGATDSAVKGAEDVAKGIVEVIQKSIGMIMDGAEKALTVAAAASTGGMSTMASEAGGKGGSEAMPSPSFGAISASKPSGARASHSSASSPTPSPSQDEDKAGLSKGMKPRPNKGF